ncbi:MAG: hypothetical protein AAFX79_06300 [Planctomycetota bacterium]
MKTNTQAGPADVEQADARHTDAKTTDAGDAPSTTTRSRGRRWWRRIRNAAVVIAGASMLVLVASCIHIDHHNPDYPATNAEVREALREMKADPIGHERPIVVLSGYRSPGAAGSMLADRIRELTGADKDQLLAISFPMADDIPPIADDVASQVAERFGSDVDPETGRARTTEVDVIAISMGGLVARTAAADASAVGRANDMELRIGTLYTFGTPHRGATLAKRIHLDAAAKQMIPGSEFIQTLNAQPRGYEIVPYAVLRDAWVGATNSAPPDQEPIWVPGRLLLSHHLITLEDRIVADLARRMRGEPPLGRPSKPPRN